MTAKLDIHVMIIIEAIKQLADGQVLSQTPWIFIHALLISHFLSGFLSFLMYVGAAIGKSMEEKVHKVLPMCIDEVTSLKINTTVCTLHLILLTNFLKVQFNTLNTKVHHWTWYSGSSIPFSMFITSTHNFHDDYMGGGMHWKFYSDKWIIHIYVLKIWTGLTWLMYMFIDRLQNTVIKVWIPKWEFLDQLSNY